MGELEIKKPETLKFQALWTRRESNPCLLFTR